MLRTKLRRLHIKKYGRVGAVRLKGVLSFPQMLGNG